MHFASALPLLGLLTFVAASPVNLEARGCSSQQVGTFNKWNFGCDSSCDCADDVCKPQQRCTDLEKIKGCYRSPEGRGRVSTLRLRAALLDI